MIKRFVSDTSHAKKTTEPQTSIRRKQHQSPVKAVCFVCFFRQSVKRFIPLYIPRFSFVSQSANSGTIDAFYMHCHCKTSQNSKHACVCTYWGKSYHYDREEDRGGGRTGSTRQAKAGPAALQPKRSMLSASPSRRTCIVWSNNLPNIALQAAG